MGKQRSTITNYLRLLRFESDPDIKQGIVEGKISMADARACRSRRLCDPQFRLPENCIDLFVRAVEALIASYQESRKSDQAKPKKALLENLRNIQDQFRAFFGAKVDLKRDEKGKGQLVVKFDNDADLNRLIELIEK